MEHTNPAFHHDPDKNGSDLTPPIVQSQTSDVPHQRNEHKTKIEPNVGSVELPNVVIENSQDNKTNISKQEQQSSVEYKNIDLQDTDSYYSLTHLSGKRRGKRQEDSTLSKHVKRFYKKQDELIDNFERLHNHGTENEQENDPYVQEKEKTRKKSNILTKVSFAANICLFILKIVGAATSKSLSVVSSVIDSAVDLATSLILFMAMRAIKKRDKYRYPQGRTRLEPLAIIILSVIMCAASVLVIYESINTIVNDASYFTQKNTTKTLTNIDMSALPISVMVITIVSKVILFLLCFRVQTPTMSALASDHRNDVASNVVALFCGLIGSFAYRNKISQKAIVVDPVGAIVISFYIIAVWIRQARDQIKRLSGYTADPRFLSQLTWLTYHHSSLILKIDTVRAFYFGTSYFVEVDIVLPEDMSVKVAHDIAESLQKKIEELPEVERAFVHIDHECDHKPTSEHKIV